MSDALFDAVEDAPAEVPAGKFTATDVRDMLHARYSQTMGNGPRYICAAEVRNVAGFGGYWSGGKQLRTCDFMALDTWHSGPVRLIGHEVKVSRGDWLRELADPSKSQAFTEHVAEWWLVIADRAIVRDGELPDGWGLLVATAGGALRASVRPWRKEQPPLDVSLVAALCRAMIRTPRGAR